MEALQPTPERMRHDAIVQVPSPVRAEAGIMAHQVQHPHALDRYYARCELADTPAENARRYEAGCLLRLEWEESGAEAVVVGGYEAAVDGFRDPEKRLVRSVDALRTWRRYIQAIGPECSWYCILACCAGLPAGKGNMDKVRRGLARLAEELRV